MLNPEAIVIVLVFAGLALISTIIEDVHPVTVEVHVHGDRSREDILIEAGQDVLALTRAMMVLKRRGQDRPKDLQSEGGDDA